MRARITRAAVAAVVLLPLLYAGLYLWSFWDPQGNVDNLPVALVVEDRPATVNGKTVDAGADLRRELLERRVFDWRAVSAQEAARGVRAGDYYMSLTIPRDFSAKLGTPSDTGTTPSPAQLGVRVDMGRSYIAETIASTVFSEVKQAAGRTAIKDYFDQVFVSFGDLREQTRKAADGAGDLAEGAAELNDGAGRLADGLGSARSGATRLESGLGTAKSGAERLADGAGKLTGGAAKLSEGAGTLAARLDEARKAAKKIADGNAAVSEQVGKLSPLVNDTADKLVPFLEKEAPRIRSIALAVADIADALADALGTLPAEVRRTAADADRAYERLERTLGAHPDLEPEVREQLKSAVAQARRVADAAQRLDGSVKTSSLADLRRQAREVADTAEEIARIAPTLGGRLEDARGRFNKLNDALSRLADGSAKLTRGVEQLGAGAGQLAKGGRTLAGGVEQLGDGANELDAGLGRLHRGAADLSSGLGELGDGAGKLGNGLGRLGDGADTLSDGLREGAGKIPAFSPGERAARGDMMSEPVRLSTAIDNKVPNYGTGFAPFFVPLALWVGGMLTFMLFKPLNSRLLAGTAPPWRAALAGWLPGAAIGVLQVAVLLAVLRAGLGMEFARPVATAGYLVLASLAFMAMIQGVVAFFGAPGRVVALALLMLQLTSAGGTYPIETSPAFFRAISPYLPMSWVVSGLRRLVSGGDLTVVWQGCGVLAAFLAGGLLLTTFAAGRSRVWSMKRLHPELTL
ncbi:YhgE/Pip domain-containing protein [Bailinhaonella thermotolerans]|uniref:YhgE/Pip domain-containing protein n=2 Tax=Bailinhaonella thermotolerans TaxID=1070861 RepID=A0A3A4AXB6_9ACTN|nr:YhgE/Pip domain-containing protein [Bailinhaonella thermotolerans]